MRCKYAGHHPFVTPVALTVSVLSKVTASCGMYMRDISRMAGFKEKILHGISQLMRPPSVSKTR